MRTIRVRVLAIIVIGATAAGRRRRKILILRPRIVPRTRQLLRHNGRGRHQGWLGANWSTVHFTGRRSQSVDFTRRWAPLASVKISPVARRSVDGVVVVWAGGAPRMAPMPRRRHVVVAILGGTGIVVAVVLLVPAPMRVPMASMPMASMPMPMPGRDIAVEGVGGAAIMLALPVGAPCVHFVTASRRRLRAVGGRRGLRPPTMPAAVTQARAVSTGPLFAFPIV